LFKTAAGGLPTVVLMDTIRHLTVHIERPAQDVYEYAADPANLPEWAAGLGGSIEHTGGKWLADSPMGKVEVAFVPANTFGVLDHDVTLPSGDVVTNPVRVLADGDACDVVFTLRRLGHSDEAFQADADAITADLATLKRVLEA
jgi:hypothetical protein